MGSLEALQKALEIGGYNAPPGNLVGGAALQVEDLSVTLKAVTFSYVPSIDNKKLNRMLRNLNERNIPYKLVTRRDKKNLSLFLLINRWNRKLTVGKRVFLYRV